jgi:hypothetical protein
MITSRKKQPTAVWNLDAPFPVSPSGGKPGRAGSPHAGSTLRTRQKRWHASMFLPKAGKGFLTIDGFHPAAFNGSAL